MKNTEKCIENNDVNSWRNDLHVASKDTVPVQVTTKLCNMYNIIYVFAMINSFSELHTFSLICQYVACNGKDCVSVAGEMFIIFCYLFSLLYSIVWKCTFKILLKQDSKLLLLYKYQYLIYVML